MFSEKNNPVVMPNLLTFLSAYSLRKMKTISKSFAGEINKELANRIKKPKLVLEYQVKECVAPHFLQSIKISHHGNLSSASEVNIIKKFNIEVFTNSPEEKGELPRIQLQLLNITYRQYQTFSGKLSEHAPIFHFAPNPLDIKCIEFDDDKISPAHITFTNVKPLFSYFVNDEEDFQSKETPLFAAARAPYFTTMQSLLIQGVNPNTQNYLGNTFLHELVPSVKTQPLEAAIRLINFAVSECGADLSLVNLFGQRCVDVVGNRRLISFINKKLSKQDLKSRIVSCHYQQPNYELLFCENLSSPDKSFAYAALCSQLSKLGMLDEDNSIGLVDRMTAFSPPVDDEFTLERFYKYEKAAIAAVKQEENALIINLKPEFLLNKKVHHALRKLLHELLSPSAHKQSSILK